MITYHDIAPEDIIRMEQEHEDEYWEEAIDPYLEDQYKREGFVEMMREENHEGKN